MSYAAHAEQLIGAAHGAASARGVSITLLAESHADNRPTIPRGTSFPELDAIGLHWPAADRPHGAALHAKVIVVEHLYRAGWEARTSPEV